MRASRPALTSTQCSCNDSKNARSAARLANLFKRTTAATNCQYIKGKQSIPDTHLTRSWLPNTAYRSH